MKLGSSAAWREAAGPGEQDDDKGEPRERCFCGAFLSREPNESRQVLDHILTWGEMEPDAEGMTQPYPLECTWAEEPYWRCRRCGHEFDYDALSE